MKKLIQYICPIIILGCINQSAYADAPGGVETSGRVNGIYFEFREGEDTTPENGLGGFFRARGYVDNFTHVDDVMLNEDSTSINMTLRTKLNVTTAGNYRFRLAGLDDDGAVFVDGVNRLTGSCCGNRDSGNVFLSAGDHDLEVRFSEGGGGEQWYLQYLGPDVGGSFVNIPSNRLFVDNAQIATWYRADQNVTGSNGGNATAWSDRSGRGNNLTTQSGHDPKYYNTTANQLINFNPVIRFTDDRMNGPDYPNGISIDRAGRTHIAVASADSASGFRMLAGHGRDSSRTATGLAQNGAQGGIEWNSTGNWAGSTWQAGRPNIVAATYTSNYIQGSNNVSVYDRGLNVGNSTRTDARTQLNDNSDIAVGTAPDRSNGWVGRIAEVIDYPWVLNTAERRRVLSYLAIKYGIMLHASVGEYQNSQGQLIFDHNDGADSSGLDWGYVAGIMKDNGSSLDQRIGRSQVHYNGGGLGSLTVSTDGNFTSHNAAHANTLSDGQSLVWGAKHQATNTLTSAGVDLSRHGARINRWWRFRDRGAVGNVNLKFENLPALPQSGVYALLVSTTDGNFTSATEIKTSSNGTFTNVNFPDNQRFYVTIAIKNRAPASIAPGNLRLWYKADSSASPSGNGNNVTLWRDISAYVNNATPGNSPRFRNNNTDNINFNPVLDFDGEGDHFNFGTSGFPFGNAARSTFIVSAAGTNNPANRALNNSVYSFPFAYGSPSSGQAYFLGQVNNDYIVGGYGNDLPLYNDLWVVNEPQLIGADYSGSTAKAYRSGYQVASAGKSWNTVASQARIGNQINTAGEYFDGKIAEVIHYNKTLSSTEFRRVHTYLGLKYGISLTADISHYENSAGTIIFDHANPGLDWDFVAGIIRDDGAGLHQRIAKSQRDFHASYKGELTVSTNTNFTDTNTSHPGIGNNQSLVWGAKHAATNQATGNDYDSSKYDGRIDRVWKFRDVGGVGAVNLKFDNLVGVGEGTYYLLIDTDQTFASGSTVLAQSSTGTFTNVDFPNNAIRYVTIAFVKSALPGVGANNLRLWLTADQDVGVNGTGVASAPFTSLKAANKVNRSGIYYFNVNGQTFSTYVDKNGWILAASGEADTAPATYAQTSSLTLQSDKILPSAVFMNAMSDVTRVRIQSTSGPSPKVDIISNHTTVLSRLRSFTPLTYSNNEQSFWNGTGGHATITCNGLGSHTTLDQQVYHSCGGSGLHWIPGRSDENTLYDSSNSADKRNDLNLWVSTGVKGGEEIALWSDRSGNAFHVVADTNKRPRLKQNAINFHSALRFTARQAMYRNASDVLNASGNDASTILAIAKRAQPAAGGNDIVSFPGSGITGGHDRPGFGIRSTNRLWVDIYDGASNSPTAEHDLYASGLASEQPYLFSLRLKNTNAADGIKLGINGISGEDTIALSNPVDSTTPIVIGAENNNLSEGFYGDIAEILIYNRVLNDSEMRISSSYLALKYGITLAVSGSSAASNNLYLNEAGATVFDYDDSNNGGYDWIRVAGIFKNQSGSGDQRIARSEDDGAILTISTDSNFAKKNKLHADTLSKGQYLVWGSKAPAIDQLNTTNINTANYVYRLARHWRMHNTGSVGAVNLWFSKLPKLLTGQQYVLLGSNTLDNFNSPTILGTSSANNGTFNNITFPNGVSYFTIAVTHSTENGTAANPFTSLVAARALAGTDGIYHFNISGNTFSTQVLSNANGGWVLLASGNDTGSGVYTSTSNLTLQSDRTLPPAIFHSLLDQNGDLNAVRLQSTSGTPALDITATDSEILSRVTSYSSLAYKTGDQNYWSGTGHTTHTNITCNSTADTLARKIYHACGNGSGIHWIPSGDSEKVSHGSGSAKNNLNLWARGPDVAPSIATGFMSLAARRYLADSQSLVLNYAAQTADSKTPGLHDYIRSRITGVTAENFALINNRLNQLQGNGISLLSDLNDRVVAILKTEQFLQGQGQLELRDLQDIGLHSVINTNLSSILSAFEKQANRILKDGYGTLQEIIDSINALSEILSAIEKDSQSDITFEKLNKIFELDNLVEANISLYINLLVEIGSSKIDNLVKLKAAIYSINRLATQLHSSNTVITLDDLSLLGITGINGPNIADIVVALRGKSFAQVNSIANIQKIINHRLDELKASAPIPDPFAQISLSQFTQAGITGLTETNIQAIKKALYKAYTEGHIVLTSPDLIKQVQAVVDQAIIAIAIAANPLNRLLDAIISKDKSLITQALLDELQLNNLAGNAESIYQDFLIQYSREQLDTIDKLQIEVDKISQHILALQEAYEDSISGSNNANSVRVSLQQLQSVIGLKNVVVTLETSYQNAFSNKSDFASNTPSVNALQDIINQVNLAKREQDSDSDGIADVLETQLNMLANDVNNPIASGNNDGDLDGLSAAQEMLLGSSDLNIDSDSAKTAINEAANNINDSIEDFDGDGIPNKTEFIFGVNPMDPDTPVEGGANNFDINGNGIRDSIDIFLQSIGLKTISITADADGDGLTDVQEIQQGSDPRKSNAQQSNASVPPTTINSSGGSGAIQWWWLSLLLSLLFISKARPSRDWS